jgi:hypothetical protein
MKRNLLTTLTLAFVNFFCAQAQQDAPGIYTERVELHVNTDFLLTGETLYYSIHCFGSDGSKYSTLSKLVYVELIGENEKPLLQNKVSLAEGRGAGDFFLPSTLPSGNYTLIGYTKWMRNFPYDHFFQRQITVINPYVKPFVSTTQNQANKSKTVTNPGKGGRKETTQLQLNSDKKEYAPRQKVMVTIKNNDPEHQVKISLNVHRSTTPPTSNTTGSIISGSALKKETINILPDLRGETITGVVKDISSGKTVVYATVYLSVPGISSIFQISRPDSVGRFIFSTKNIHTSEGLQFQVDHPASVDIILDDEFVNEYKKFKPLPLSVDTSMRKEIEQRNVYSQIENAYFTNKRDSNLVITVPHFFQVPDKVYRLDDFTRFPTMEDIFREYMYEVVVSKRDGKFLLRLINSTTKNGARFTNTPLMVMDGIPIFDTDILMSYNPLLIKTVSIVTRPYVFSGTLYDGIISINTYLGNARELNVKSIRKEYTSWQFPKKYYSPVYRSSESLARVPDYRIQLYWEPIISIEPGHEIAVELYTSDVEGNFLLAVKGFDSMGREINVSQPIEVRKQR